MYRPKITEGETSPIPSNIKSLSYESKLTKMFLIWQRTNPNRFALNLFSTIIDNLIFTIDSITNNITLDNNDDEFDCPNIESLTTQYNFGKFENMNFLLKFMNRIENELDLSGDIREHIIEIYNNVAQEYNFKQATSSTTTGMFSNVLIVVDSPPDEISQNLNIDLLNVIRQYTNCVQGINNSFKVELIVCKYHGNAGMTTNVAIQKCPTQFFISADDDDISCGFNYLSKAITNIITESRKQIHFIKFTALRLKEDYNRFTFKCVVPFIVSENTDKSYIFHTEFALPPLWANLYDSVLMRHYRISSIPGLQNHNDWIVENGIWYNFDNYYTVFTCIPVYMWYKPTDRYDSFGRILSTEIRNGRRKGLKYEIPSYYETFDCSYAQNSFIEAKLQQIQNKNYKDGYDDFDKNDGFNSGLDNYRHEDIKNNIDNKSYMSPYTVMPIFIYSDTYDFTKSTEEYIQLIVPEFRTDTVYDDKKNEYRIHKDVFCDAMGTDIVEGLEVENDYVKIPFDKTYGLFDYMKFGKILGGNDWFNRIGLFRLFCFVVCVVSVIVVCVCLVCKVKYGFTSKYGNVLC